MNDELKAVRNLGAELGAAKAEVARLREALRPFAVFEAVRSKQGGCTPKSGTVWAVSSAGEETEITVEHLQAAVAALSQKAEPDCVACEGNPAACNNPCALCGKHADRPDTYTAVDMATAAAQGFRDGQAAVEQAPAQDGLMPDEIHQMAFEEGQPAENGDGYCFTAEEFDLFVERLLSRANRPAQTEQSGLVEAAGAVIRAADWWSANEDSPKSALAHFVRAADALRAALSAQGADEQ